MAEITKQALKVENNTEFPNNNNGQIKPTNLRSFNEDMIDSTVNQTGYNVDSGSWNASIQALNNYTASVIPIDTGSLLTTASFDNGTRNLTFTKGDASTFNVNIPDVSGSIISTGSLMVTGSVSGNTLTFTKGDESQFSLTVETGSSGTGNGFPFSGSAEITGSLSVSETVKSQIYINPQIISGSIVIPTGNNAMVVGPISIDGTISVEGTSKLIVLDALTGSVLPSGLVSGSSQLTASYDLRYELSGSTQPLPSGLLSSSVTNFETFSASVDTRIDNVSVDTSSLATTGSNIFIGNQTITGSLFVSQSEQGSRGGVVFRVSEEGGPGAKNGVHIDGRFSVEGPADFQVITIGSLFTDNIYSNSGGPTPITVRNNVIVFETDGGSGHVDLQFGVSGSANISGSVQIGEVMNLSSQDPLPTGSIGDLAVSGSSLYFYNGAWTLVV